MTPKRKLKNAAKVQVKARGKPATKKKVKKMAETAIASRRSQRAKAGKSFAQLIENNAPAAGGEAFGGPRGCKRAYVSLKAHPLSSGGLGSDADANLPSCIKTVRAHYGGTWVSGHVINADFGGNGKKNFNQTCLTSGANRDHTFDEATKLAWKGLTATVEAMFKEASTPDAVKYVEKKATKWLIRVEGRVSEDAWAEDGPGRYVADSVTYTAVQEGTPTLPELTQHMGAKANALWAQVQSVGRAIVSPHVVAQADGDQNE
ncbi:hypothetical protein [Streptomyces sp. NPDC047028]|uniref:hypothetical protein n=1 Tax=Streptomyces sp. NPDC047028 TaxID=3155793 RepID=UPI003400599E